MEVPARFELANESFADSCLTTWPRYHMKEGTFCDVPFFFGAGDEARTRYLHLGKVALYRMSYTRILCRPSESNCFDSEQSDVGASGRNRTNAPRIFSPLLYLLSYRGMLSKINLLKTRSCVINLATSNGLEPSTSSVTGWRANRLHHEAMWWWEQQGSNLRPPACKAAALPAELCSRMLRCVAHLSDETHYSPGRAFCQALFSFFIKKLFAQQHALIYTQIRCFPEAS